MRNGEHVCGLSPFGFFDGSLNQTDVVLNSNDEIVQKMKAGDIIKVYCEGENNTLNLLLELKYNDEPINPLFKYNCPKDRSHKLKLYYYRWSDLY